MNVQDLTSQDINIFNDTAGIALTRELRVKPVRELHWPKLALGDAYPVTDRDGRILRHAEVRDYPRGNMDLL
jgi:hypothetical protein